jgi:hypothetical protein
MSLTSPLDFVFKSTLHLSFHLPLFGSFTLFLPEGRTGVAWEPSNKMMLFLPPRKIKSLTSPLDFLFESTLHLSFPSLSLSLASCFKVLSNWQKKKTSILSEIRRMENYITNENICLFQKIYFLICIDMCILYFMYKVAD